MHRRSDPPCETPSALVASVRIGIVIAVVAALGGSPARAGGSRAFSQAPVGRTPAHPLLDPTRDPGSYDSSKTQDLGPNAPVWPNTVADWDWGTLRSGHRHPTSLTVTNNCATEEVVGIHVYAPLLSAPDQVTVPAHSSLDVSMTIITPQPLLQGSPPPGWNGVIGTITGQVVLWHPWRPERPQCLPNREVHAVSGVVVYDPDGVQQTPPPPPDPTIAVPDACAVWWNTGLRPPGGVDEQSCLEPVRDLAVAYRQEVLEPRRQADPERWAWLPDSATLREMGIGALVAFRHKAQRDD